MGAEWGKGVATEGRQEGILGVMETICILILGDYCVRGTELIEQHRAQCLLRASPREALELSAV